nr:MAG TPA: protein of unknown function DUF2116 [Caudoviricetes sp.]
MFCQKCGAEKEKAKKPIYKRPWFIILIVIIVLGAIGQGTGGETSSDGDGQETQTQGDTVDVAKENDTRIFGLLKSAEARMNGVQNNISNSTSELEIYEECKNAKTMLNTLTGKVRDYKTTANSDYVDYSLYYISTMSSACENIMKYVDKQETHYLSDAKSDMESAVSYLQSAMNYRYAYLLASGLTQEEIDAQDAQFDGS